MNVMNKEETTQQSPSKVVLVGGKKLLFVTNSSVIITIPCSFIYTHTVHGHYLRRPHDLSPL